ncbi:ATP-binding cassette domain-containing protein [Gracilibacillus sp. S3-1-1]|uniref:ATP-binding cassette domain-containing protein n=1 Tax=Gracilibacillus pellucidus TaxID=3095368 RepID=A0ACC6M378_9BACI|nr:ATP-binding cassette domain-containing protein [Gracilibacillus sp. S3-1-1]MDX8045418.1 ATP-binding cassette domain-containing protein [Gracilibacillus sp. S3-1-1]
MIEVNQLTYKSILTNINGQFDLTLNHLKGDNGVGKTTLLDCICRINNKYSGSITGNQQLVYLNQTLFFSHKLKGKDFVQFVYQLEGIKSAKQAFFQFAEENGALYDLEPLWNKKVGILSGGERKKLYFATICSLERKWYVFDEPFAGVDERGKHFITAQLKRLLQQNKGIILTPHETEPLQAFPHMETFQLKPNELTKLSTPISKA